MSLVGVDRTWCGGGRNFSYLAIAGHSPLSSGEDRDLAVKNRDIVAPKMTAAQIAEAQRLARDWKPKALSRKPSGKSQQGDTGNPFADLPLSKEAVRNIQASLLALGYKPGPADGILGSRTKSAIEAFQRDQGLPAIGEVSRKMQILLLQEMARQKAGLAPIKVELSD